MFGKLSPPISTQLKSPQINLGLNSTYSGERPKGAPSSSPPVLVNDQRNHKRAARPLPFSSSSRSRAAGLEQKSRTGFALSRSRASRPGFALASLLPRRVAARRRSSRRRSSRARSTLYARRTRSSRPSMVLNFRASSTRNALYDDDVNCDVQVHKPSRTVVPKRSVMISSNGPLRKRIFRRDP